MATTAADPVFVDSNILVYAHQALSPFHSVAIAKLQGLAVAGHPLWMSRQIMREYLVVMSRPGALTQPVSINALIADVQSMEKQFFIADEVPAVTTEC